jgi:hypothetical protein
LRLRISKKRNTVFIQLFCKLSQEAKNSFVFFVFPSRTIHSPLQTNRRLLRLDRFQAGRKTGLRFASHQDQFSKGGLIAKEWAIRCFGISFEVGWAEGSVGPHLDCTLDSGLCSAINTGSVQIVFGRQLTPMQSRCSPRPGFKTSFAG